MSLIDKKVASVYVEKPLTGEAKLVLTENIMEQIDFLHEKVGGVEWSGVLVYRIAEGSIEEYDKLVVEVLEILPMDVGTSGYTEYELDSSDEYTFDNLLDRVMSDPTLKVGHIHTHHSMPTFFSGTDTQELHDNAPNHNYYLSLIVNFKDYTNWCAKIALVGEEEQEGNITSNFKGTNGEVISKTVNIKKSTDILYTIDMDINYDAPAVEELPLTEFQTRVVELNKSKGSRRFPAATPSATGYQKYIKDPKTGKWGWQTEEEEEAGKQGELFAVKPESKAPVSETNSRVRIDMSDVSIRTFTNMIISQSNEPTGLLTSNLNTIDMALDTSDPTSAANRQIYMDGIFHSYDDLFIYQFGTTPTDTSRELVAKKVITILEAYSKEFDFLEEVIEELNVCFVYESTEVNGNKV